MLNLGLYNSFSINLGPWQLLSAADIEDFLSDCIIMHVVGLFSEYNIYVIDQQYNHSSNACS